MNGEVLEDQIKGTCMGTLSGVAMYCIKMRPTSANLSTRVPHCWFRTGSGLVRREAQAVARHKIMSDRLWR